MIFLSFPVLLFPSISFLSRRAYFRILLFVPTPVKLIEKCIRSLEARVWRIARKVKLVLNKTHGEIFETRTTFMFESILRFVYESSCDTNLWRYILLLLLLMLSVTNITHDITIITPLHSACTCFFLKSHCSTARTTEVEPFLMTYTGVEVYFVPQFYHHHCYASPKSEGTMITFGLGFPSNV